MAIVAIILAALLGYLGGRMDDPGVRRILYGIAIAAAAFALYLIIFNPRLAWDMRWLGRLLTMMAGHGFRELLR
jgi:MFS-type transporter involved in bile tolerance (Atg22 family)